MRKKTLAVVVGAALALQVTAGCARNGKPDAAPRADGQPDNAKRADSGGAARGAAQNEQNARQLLQEAESAEQQGQYSLALNLYDRLRSFPEASRPADLEQRVNRVRQKMAAEGGDPGAGGAGVGPTTLPVEPR